MEGINTFPHYVRRPLLNLWRKSIKKSSSSSISSSSILQSSSSSSSSGASLPGWVNCVYTCIQTSYKCLSHIQNKRCNSKLYMIPGGAISYRCVLRISVVAGSLELDGTTILKAG